MSTLTDDIRRVLDEHGHLSVKVDAIGDGDDLYLLGLTSHSSVNLMLALEDELGLEFPDSLMRRDTFQSVGSIRSAVESVRAAV